MTSGDAPTDAAEAGPKGNPDDGLEHGRERGRGPARPGRRSPADPASGGPSPRSLRKAERAERLEDELRANLRRRKDQARLRAAQETTSGAAAGGAEPAGCPGAADDQGEDESAGTGRDARPEQGRSSHGD